MALIKDLPLHTDHKLRISTGGKNLGKVKNKTATWGQLVTKISVPLVDINYTLPQYLQLSVAKQSDIKNVGYFVGGHCDNGVRQIGSLKDRWLITLDVDACNPGHVFDMENGDTELTPFEFFVYSTRKHTSSNPRLRIIIPLEKPIDAEAYHALSRIVAEMFDVTMESIDPVSFRATQLMYWPSICKEATFYTFHNRGDLMVAEDILENFGDWRDHTKLPRSERDESRYNAAGKKPEAPETKEGIVGAFCRVYDVPAAIDEFLPDIYIDPKDTQQGVRYTYAKGTTSHGAIVYDDGAFLYSNHMHDPAAGHSQNAFDLVRLHLFGDLDTKAKEGSSPMSMPSVKALLDHLKSDKSVAKSLRDEHYDLNQAMREPVDDENAFDSLDENDQKSNLEGDLDDDLSDWVDELDLTSEGLIKPSMHNLVLILMNDCRFSNCIRRNTFSSRKVYAKELGFKAFGSAELPVLDKINGSDWTDAHARFVKLMLESPRGKNKPGYGLRPTEKDLNDAIDHAADRQSFHPVHDYLESLKWDGKKRMRKVFIDYLGAADTEYHREVCALTLLGAVTRIYEPGHKFDYMPVLEGLQGKRKSAFVEALAKKTWFREMGDINDKNKAIEAMNGAWLLEFAELHQFGRTEITRIKEFLSMKGETTRLAYERNARNFLRQCVFIGTTNDDEYLRDNTGNRRFWPVECTVPEVNIEKLDRNVDQIWAEVVQVYKKMREDQPYGGLPLYLTDNDVKQQALEMQASRKILSNEEILADQIETWITEPVAKDEAQGLLKVGDADVWDTEGVELVKRTMTCATEIYEKVMGEPRRKITSDKSSQYLIAKAMRLIKGWKRSDKQGRFGEYGKQRVIYVKTDLDDDEI